MKMMILTPGIHPTVDEVRRKIWIFLASCAKFGVPMSDFRIYGTGRTFPGYRCFKLDWQQEWLEQNHEDFTHVLYTDSWDAFFCSPWAELLEKYSAMGKPPILVSSHTQLAPCCDERNYPNCFDRSLYAPYPNVGGYIAEIPAIIEAFSKMNRNTGDDNESWADGVRDGFFRPAIDHRASVFHVSDDNMEVNPQGRLVDKVTGETPCILHLSGGYCDQVTGKDERLKPWAQKASVL